MQYMAEFPNKDVQLLHLDCCNLRPRQRWCYNNRGASQAGAPHSASQLCNTPHINPGKEDTSQDVRKRMKISGDFQILTVRRIYISKSIFIVFKWNCRFLFSAIYCSH